MSFRLPCTRLLIRPLATAALGCMLVGSPGSRAAVAAPQWLTWNAGTHTAKLTLVANYTNALAGFNFNGYGNGKMVVTVPLGARVKVTFRNRSAAATHSVLITPYADRNSSGTFPVAFKGASSSDPTVGISKGTTEHFSFTATKVGKYAIVCAVPGHVPAGMWDVFKVATSGPATITFK